MEDPHVPRDLTTGIGPRSSHETSTSALENKTEEDRIQSNSASGLDFEFHYDGSSTTGQVLSYILSDVASFQVPQDWDKRQHMNQLKIMASSAKRYIDNVDSGEVSELTNYSTVEDVFISNDTVTRRPVNSSTSTYLFPSKVYIAFIVKDPDDESLC